MRMSFQFCSEPTVFYRKYRFFLIIFISLLSLGYVFYRARVTTGFSSSKEKSQETQALQAFHLAERQKQNTEEALQRIRLVPPGLDQAQAAFQIYREKASNVFFDPALFFQRLILTDQDIEYFQARLLDFASLKDLQVTRDNVPEIVEERMALIDFLGNYVLEKAGDSTTRLVVDSFVTMLIQDFPAEMSPTVKRIVISEKMDFIRLLTVIEPELAAQTLNSLDAKQKEHLRTNYYIGLKARDLSEEEYQSFVNKVL